MKSVTVIIAAILSLLAGEAAAGVFGPPEPLADPGQVSVGAGYFLDRTRMKQGDDRLGTRSNQYSLQADYTFVKNWEIYGRVGGADMVVRDHDTQQRFGDNMSAFGTLGVKGVLYRQGNFAFGPFAEASYYGDRSGMMTSQWDTSFGLSAQYKVRVVTIYGGPFAYFRQADRQLALNPAVAADDVTARHHLGAFLGVRVPVVKEKVFVTAEAQMRDRPGLGASVNYKF